MNEILIISGGIFNIAFAVFHLLFWKIFDWQSDLRNLTFINRNIMQILNLCLTFTFLIFAYLSLFHTEELLSTSLGHSILVLISIFWLLRALEQVWFFTLKKSVSIAFFVFFLFGATIYAIPATNII